MLTCLIGLALIVRERKHIDTRAMLALLIPASIAAPLTAFAIRGLSPELLWVASGVLVLIAIAALASGFRIRRLVGHKGAVIAGSVSGAMNVVGGVAGPAAASYALKAEWPVEKMRATFAAYFFGVNVVSVASRGIPEMTIAFFAACLAIVASGLIVGHFLAHRSHAESVRRAIFVLAGLGGVMAIVNGLF